MTEITSQEATSAEVIDHEYTSEVVCPYCGHEHIESYNFESEVYYNCAVCSEIFSVERIIEVSYTTSKIEGTVNEFEELPVDNLVDKYTNPVNRSFDLPHKPTQEELEELFAEGDGHERTTRITTSECS